MASGRALATRLWKGRGGLAILNVDHRGIRKESYRWGHNSFIEVSGRSPSGWPEDFQTIGREILRAGKIETGQQACCVARANESSAGACTGSGLQRGRASPCSDAGLPVAAEPLWKNFDNGSITPVTPSSPIGRLPSSLAIERRRSSVRRHRIWANGREDHHAIAFVARAPFRLSIAGKS